MTKDRPRTLTKAILAESVYEKSGVFSKAEAAKAVDAVFDLIKENLEEGTKVKVAGFGKFVLHDKSERVGRDPQTGALITISARRVISFRPSTSLRGRLNH